MRREIEYLLPDTDSEKRIAWMLTGVIGYRYQSSDGFFQFRVGATPSLVLHDNGVYSRKTMIRPYLSLGVHF